MTKLTEIEELAAASDPSGKAIVVGVKGPEGARITESCTSMRRAASSPRC